MIKIQDLIQVSIPNNHDLFSENELRAYIQYGQDSSGLLDQIYGGSIAKEMTEEVKPLRVCLYRSNNLSSHEVRETLHKMFGHYKHIDVTFILVGMGNSSAQEWIEEHQYEFETYDAAPASIYQQVIKNGIDIFIEFNRKGTGTSSLAQVIESNGIYTYIVEL